MTKTYIVLFALGMALFTACKKDDSGDNYNPSNPIVVNAIAPQQGTVGTDILISGSNFSTDTSQIKVSINGVRLRIVGATGDRILAFLPAKTGTGPVEVTIGDNKAASASNFVYNFTYVVSTLAGSGNASYIDGKGEGASFNFNGVRAQLSVDDAGNVYVPDGGNQRIRKVAPDGTVTTIAGTGENGFADGPGADAKFNNPCGTAVDASGNVYVSERNGRRIRKITPAGVVSTHATGNGNGTNELTAVVVNKNNGNIYWSDFYGDGVYVLKNGTITRVINYSLPCTIAIDAQGNIYATHYDAHAVRKYTYNATNDSFDNGVDYAGKNGQSGLTDGIGDNARFNRPFGVAVDASNNVYVSGLGEDRNSNCVRMINPARNVTTIAGAAERGYAEGIGGAARFNAPTGIAVGKDGNLYVLDMANQRIRKITVQ